MHRIGLKLTGFLVLVVTVAAACGGDGTDAGGAGGAGGGKEEVTVALLFGGIANDGGFDQQMWDSLQQVAKEDGAVKPVLRERLTEGGQTAYEAAVREFGADPSVDLVIAHGIDLGAAVDKFAPQFPNARFVHSYFLPSGDLPKNVNLYLSIFEEIGYAAGFVTAMTTKTGHVGFIGGPEFPFLHQELFGFEAALADYLPDGMEPQVEVVFTGDWNDVQTGREAALSMGEKGVDSMWNVLAGGAIGVVSTCIELDVWCPGNSSYSETLGPEAVPASAVHGDYGVLIQPWVDAIRDGTWDEKFGGQETPLTLQNGVTTVTDATASGNTNFPELQPAIEQFRAAALAGEIQVPTCDTTACTG